MILKFIFNKRDRYWTRSSGYRMASLLEQEGFALVDRPEDADILLIGSHHGLAEVTPRDGQIIDVVGGTRLVTHKGRLARLLREHGIAADLQAETFLIDDDPREIDLLRARARALPEAVWIKKPLARGRGIGVEPIVDVASWLATRAAPGPNGPELVQRYITNPLLLEGTKSELRSYILIACADPLLVLYHDGTVRLTSLPFVHGDWSNPLVHVTNTYRQKHADPEGYAERSARLKWTLPALGQDVFARGLTDDPAWVDTTLRPALIAMIRAVVRALAPSLEHRRGSFQLLGMDSILSDDLEDLWLTEIQLGPGLSVDDPVKAQLVPAMLREAAAIVFEIRDRQRRGEDPRELSARRGFQWVYREPEPAGLEGDWGRSVPDLRSEQREMGI